VLFRSGDDRALIFYNNSYYQAAGWICRGAVAIPRKDGSYRQDSLCEALGLHGDARFFTVFREQRSALWYIRSSKEIAERGLYAALNGYEAQVFLDIQEKEDAPGAPGGSLEGRWAMLNHGLNGRGVKNIDEALLDICLRELYDPFREILSPRRMEELVRFFSPPEDGDSPVPREFIESFREPVNAFITAAKNYLGGGGRFIPFGSVNSDENDQDEKEWFTGLENLLALAELIPPKKSAPGRTKKTAERFLRKLAVKIRKRPALASFALGYNTLTLLRSVLLRSMEESITPNAARAGENAPGRALALHWQLDRITRECWENAGINGEEARRAAEIALALLARTGQPLSAHGLVPKTPKNFASALILENYETPDFRKILGVNRFDDVTWFNKEAFEETLLLAPFFLAIDARRQCRIETIAAVTETFRQAEKVSGYRFDGLSGALSELREEPPNNGPVEQK
jgi:hypothetical protein